MNSPGPSGKAKYYSIIKTQPQLFDTPTNFNSPFNQPTHQATTTYPNTTAIMTRGEASQTKIHFKGADEDFIIFVEDAKIAKDWKTDKTIPLAQVVSAFKIFVTHKHGAQGELNTASKSTLENEFGTHNEEDVIKQIIEKGSIQEVEGAERQGSKNDSMGSRAAH